MKTTEMKVTLGTKNKNLTENTGRKKSSMGKPSK
jgi:hypothetical protein